MTRRRNGNNDRALIAEVKGKLFHKSKPDIMDWTLALMRRGFSKEEAKALFFKEGYLIDSRGSVVAPPAKKAAPKLKAAGNSQTNWSPTSDSKQYSIDKTLAEMEERRKRMATMAEAARTGRSTIKPPSVYREPHIPRIEITPAKVEPIPVARNIEELLRGSFDKPVKAKALPPQETKMGSSDLDKRFKDLNSGWERLRRMAQEARGK